MASNVEQQQPWDDGVDICGQAVPMDNDEGWRRAVASMKQKDEPMHVENDDDDGGLYERLMRDDERINAQLSDLRAAHRAGALDREAFSAQALERRQRRIFQQRRQLGREIAMANVPSA